MAEKLLFWGIQKVIKLWIKQTILCNKHNVWNTWNSVGIFSKKFLFMQWYAYCSKWRYADKELRSKLYMLFMFMIVNLRNMPTLTNMFLSQFSASFTAALQVSISLNKVELSVGESKFFICTGKNYILSSYCPFASFHFFVLLFHEPIKLF